MARIGVEGLMISPSGKGLARVQGNAAQALAARGEHEVVVFVQEPVELSGVEVAQVDARPALAWETVGLPRAIRRHRLDAVVTYTERLPVALPVPTVVWLFESPVHRMDTNRRTRAPLRHRLSDLLTRSLWKRSLRRASHVVTGSRATEVEVLAEIPELAGRTSVVYPALAAGFGPGPVRREDQYVFHLGSNDPRDGTATAVEACRLSGSRLLVAGGWDGAGAESLGRVSDAELVDLYRGASVFLDPTLYEGFGYGVLEAMACGAPVVASDTTSIPEIVEDAGLLCDPRSSLDFSRAIRRVLEEPGLAEELRARGYARASTFSWNRTAEGLSAAIAAALS